MGKEKNLGFRVSGWVSGWGLPVVDIAYVYESMGIQWADMHDM